MDLAALRRWWPLAAVVVLLALSGLAAAHSTAQLERIEQAESVGDAAPQGEAPPPQDEVVVAPSGDVPEGLPSWLGLAALGVLGLLLLMVIVLVVRALLKDRVRTRRAPRRPQPTAQNAADEVVAALEAGLLDLSDADTDPRRAVIACWVRLEQAAAAAGTPRRPDDTATDLVGRLLAEQNVSADVLGGFAAVYREARYATRVVDERMRVDARAALHRLREDLSAGVGNA
jgi:hypothetical protein